MALLAPSGYLAWKWRQMPQLGAYHDDAIYWVTAKSIAEGRGYRIESFPGSPYQTKYPPLYPLLLALIWRADGDFPANLRWATLLAWALLPVYLLLLLRLCREFGMGRRGRWALAALAALNPVVVAFSLLLMSELLFCVLLVAVMVVAERALRAEASVWLPLAAGLLAGAAFLTRSAGLLLMMSGLACFLLRKQLARAALFACGMLPAVAGWHAWAAAHAPAGHDPATLYYTSYAGFHFAAVSARELLALIWRNLGGLVFGTGELLLFTDSVSFWSVQLGRLLTAGAIAGTVRLARRRGLLQFPVFALCYGGVLLLWHFPPESRFVMPLLPLLLAGLWTEMRHLAGAVRRSLASPGPSNRFCGGVAVALLACVGLVAMERIYHGLRRFLPEVLEHHQRMQAPNEAVYAWVRDHTRADSLFLSYSDPLLYLHTGRRALGWRAPPHMRGDSGRQGVEEFIESLPLLSSAHPAEYVLLSHADFQMGTPVSLFRKLEQRLATSSSLKPACRSEHASVYQITTGE